MAKATARTPVDEAIERALPRIIEACQPHLIILYGSRAYGTPREDSDIDLLVITEASGRAVQTAVDAARPAGSPYVSILARAAEDARSRLALGDPVLRDAARAGRVLYDRTGQGLDYLRQPPAHLVDKGDLGLNPMTEEWVRKAETDRVSARALADVVGLQANDPVAFHAQQQTEKYLKALLQERGTPPPRTHDLLELLGMVEPPHPGLVVLSSELEALTPFAVVTRYIGRDTTDDEAAWALNLAERVRAIVRQALGLPLE
ncbi:MAG TPA: HEPN domain-containing protein [Armatimonadota bacterium]|nr:HEPN domain-containing protein [Armatimonadota bacterium]HQK93122.1 HEPN domain-containing protein [Armatimonadota bacterium]